jgi:hypothetical protein
MSLSLYLTSERSKTLIGWHHLCRYHHQRRTKTPPRSSAPSSISTAGGTNSPFRHRNNHNLGRCTRPSCARWRGTNQPTSLRCIKEEDLLNWLEVIKASVPAMADFIDTDLCIRLQKTLREAKDDIVSSKVRAPAYGKTHDMPQWFKYQFNVKESDRSTVYRRLPMNFTPAQIEQSFCLGRN